MICEHLKWERGQCLGCGWDGKTSPYPHEMTRDDAPVSLRHPNTLGPVIGQTLETVTEDDNGAVVLCFANGITVTFKVGRVLESGFTVTLP